MTIKIVQSQTIFNILNLNTYRAALVDGAQVFVDDTNGLMIPAENVALDEVLVVLPIDPYIGDSIVSIYEGDLVTGKIVGTTGDLDGNDYIVQFDTIDFKVSLKRNQFHVTAAGDVSAHNGLSVGDELVIVVGTANFPYGTTAIVKNIAQTKGIPSITVVLAQNNCEWTWDLTGVGVRYLDKTVIDFSFDGEVEPFLTPADLITETSADSLPNNILQENEEAMSEDISEHLDQVLGAADESITLTPTVDLPEDLQSEHLDFAITDANGNAVAWADLPEEVQGALRGVIGEVSTILNPLAADGASGEEVAAALAGAFGADAQVLAEEELADAAGDDEVILPGLEFGSFMDELFGALFGPSIFAAAAEAERARQVDLLAQTSVAAEEDHKEYIADSYEEIEEHNTETIRNVALALNLLGRTIKTQAGGNPALAHQLSHINDLLTSARNSAFNVDKAILDAMTDIQVNTAVQENIADRAATLIH